MAKTKSKTSRRGAAEELPTLDLSAPPLDVDQLADKLARGELDHLRHLIVAFERWDRRALAAARTAVPETKAWTEEHWRALLLRNPRPVAGLPPLVRFPLESLALVLEDAERTLPALETLELVGRFDQTHEAQFPHLSEVLTRCPSLRHLSFHGQAETSDYFGVAPLDEHILPPLVAGLDGDALDTIVFRKVAVNTGGLLYSDNPVPRPRLQFESAWAQDWVPDEDPEAPVRLNQPRRSQAPLGLMRIQSYWQRNVMRPVSADELQRSAIYTWLTCFVSRFAHSVRALVMRERVFVDMEQLYQWGTPDLVFNEEGERFYRPSRE